MRSALLPHETLKTLKKLGLGTADLHDRSIGVQIATTIGDEPEGIGRILDKFPGVECLFQVCQVNGDGGRSWSKALRGLESVARQGYLVPAEAVTDFNRGLRDRISEALDANDGAGLRLYPCSYSRELNAQSGTDLVQELTLKLASILHVCEPWRGIMQYAAAPGDSRLAVSLSPYRYRLRADGRLARSPREQGKILTPNELSGALDPGQGRWSRKASWEHQPDCAKCSIRVLCPDSQPGLSPTECTEVSERPAKGVGEYQCSVNQFVIGLLLDEARAMHKEPTGRNDAVALVFQDGTVSYRAVSDKGDQ